MPYRKFILFDSVGALSWVSLFILAGYSVGWQLDGVKEEYRHVSATLAAALGISVAGYLLAKLYRRRHLGTGSIRGRTVARVVNAPPPGPGRASSSPFASTRPAIVPGEENGIDQDGTRRVQDCINPSPSGRET
jgi:hypothetical protein